jgi:pimeloyl-ACP methyl ester carboxylesterase
MSTFVLIHGAWHRGELLEPVAEGIRAKGHRVFTPTVLGNRPGDSKAIGLDAAIESIVDYFKTNTLWDVVLVGHSYGGMIITGVADRCPERIRRLVYWNAFVPNNGESANDMRSPQSVAAFDQMAAASGDNTVMPSPSLWREVFFNDGSAEQAAAAFAQLNRHPYATFVDKIKLSRNPADMQVGKSYINFTDDTAQPHTLPWHPRLSSKLGVFRLIQASGGHEVCFSNPALAAQKILEAGRD